MKIYNTLSKRKEEFVPLEEGKVKMYVCGPTVYNLIHIGNARPMIVFDTVRRYMEHKGYEVNYVSNFTDVDDKIIKKAIEEGVDASVISERYIAECKKDMEAMNWGNPVDEVSEPFHKLFSSVVGDLDEGYFEMKRQKDAIAVNDIMRDLQEVLTSGTLPRPDLSMKFLFIDELSKKLFKSFRASSFLFGRIESSKSKIIACAVIFSTFDKNFSVTGTNNKLLILFINHLNNFCHII